MIRINNKEPRFTSVSITRENYDELHELSKTVIKGIVLSIPQTIKYLASVGLSKSIQTKDINNENRRSSE